jgi:hypothetical protein
MQGRLFDTTSPDMTPLFRATDPETSRLAAAEIADHLPELHAWALDCVRESPGLTQRELGAKYCPEDLRKIGRRLGELVRRGLLREGDARSCSITGRAAGTYWPVEG